LRDYLKRQSLSEYMRRRWCHMTCAQTTLPSLLQSPNLG
jgi:hypothetical protein